MRLSLPGNKANFEFANRYSAMGTVYMGVHSGAGLQFQHVLFFVKCPNAGKCGIEIIDYCFCTMIKNFL